MQPVYLQYPIAIFVSGPGSPNCEGLYKFALDSMAKPFYRLNNDVKLVLSREATAYVWSMIAYGQTLYTIYSDSEIPMVTDSWEIVDGSDPIPNFQFHYAPVSSFFGQAKNDDAKKRFYLFREFYETEKSFNEDLQILSRFKESVLGNTQFAELSDLLLEHEPILEVSKKFLDLMNSDLHLGSHFSNFIPQRFLQMAPEFMAYHKYCMQYNQVIQRLSKKKDSRLLNQFQEEFLSIPAARHLTYESFIVKPVQRVCKYHLFFRDLLKVLPQKNEHLKQMEQALEASHELAEKINEEMKKSETMGELKLFLKDKVNYPSDFVIFGRRFIKEYRIQYSILQQRKQNGFLFLFNDSLLLSKAPSKNIFSSSAKYHIINSYMLKNLELTEIPSVVTNSDETEVKQIEILDSNFENASAPSTSRGASVMAFFESSEGCTDFLDTSKQFQHEVTDSVNRHTESSVRDVLGYLKQQSNDSSYSFDDQLTEMSGSSMFDYEKSIREQRRTAYDHLIEKEKQYLEDLKICQEKYIVPLSRKAGRSYTLDQIQKLFDGWSDYIALQEEIVQELDAKSATKIHFSRSLPQVFLKHIQQLSLYKFNPTRQTRMKMIFDQLKEIKTFKRTISPMEDFETYLVSPLKRIEELVLSVTEILLKMDPEHIGYSEFVQLLNELARYTEGKNDASGDHINCLEKACGPVASTPNLQRLEAEYRY